MLYRWNETVYLPADWPGPRTAGPELFFPVRRVRELDRNALMGALLAYGSHEVLDYLLPGEPGYLTGYAVRCAPSHFLSYHRLIEWAQGTLPASQEDADWLGGVRDVSSRLVGEDIVGLVQEGRGGGQDETLDRAVIHFALRWAGLLDALCGGYKDPRDPLCPACAQAGAAASPQAWRLRISAARRYVSACNRIRVPGRCGLSPLGIGRLLRYRPIRDIPHILVVDDERDVSTLMKYIFENEGWRVSLAGDGRAGVESALREQPDLILLNYMMPVMDGFTALKTLRDDPRTEAIRVIFFSASDTDWVREYAFALGAVDFMATPFDPQVLLKLVRCALRRVRR